MKHRQREAGILLTYCNELVKILTVLLYTPLMLRLLGQREYGLYQLAASLVSQLSLLSFGFGSSYIRSHSQCREDGEALSKINGMFLLIFSGMSILCMICGGFLASRPALTFGETLTPMEYAKARKLLLLLTFNMALTFPNSLFEGYLQAREAFRFQRLLRLAQSILNPFLALPLLLLGYGCTAVAGVSTVLTLAVFLGNGYHCFRKLGMAVSFRGLEWSQLGSLGRFSFFIFLNQLIDQLNWSVDKLLLGRMTGAEAVAVYGIGAQLLTLYIHLSTAISAVFAPEVHRIVTSGGDNTQLSNLMIRVGRGQLLLLGLVFSGYLCFGRSFLRLWAGPENEEAFRVGLLLMAPMTIPLVQNMGLEIQRAKNKHQARALIYAALAFVNVLLSTRWIPIWGCTGAAAATALTQFLGTGLFMNWYYHRHLQLDMARFWRGAAKLALPPFLSCCMGFPLTRKIQSWGRLLAAIFLYTLFYLLIAFRWGLNREEKEKIKQILPKRRIYHGNL